MKYLQKKDNQSFPDDDICRSSLDIFHSRAIVFLNKMKMENRMKNRVPFPHDILRSPKWEWHIPDAPVAEAVRSLDLKDGMLVKSSSVRAVYHCGDYFLKFEFGINLLTSLRNRLRPKARQEYAIGRSLAAAGIPAVECLGWGRLGGTNVLLTRALPGCVSVDEYYYTHIVHGGENPDRIVSEITAYLRKFFDAGFLHRDLHFGNILYDPDKHAFALVDLIEISRPRKLADADRKVMSRCIVTLRAGLNRAQMLRAIRDIGAADSDDEAEKYYFDEVRRTARHLKETWPKRRSQILNAYPKFTEAVPCPEAPLKTVLLRKDWLSRPILTPDDIKDGIPPDYERFVFQFSPQIQVPNGLTNEKAAEDIFLTSMCLQILRVRHRRVVAFIRPNELWLEPMPEGLAPAFPAPDGDKELKFFLRTLKEMMIDVERQEDVRKLPDGFHYLLLVESNVPMTVHMGVEYFIQP